MKFNALQKALKIKNKAVTINADLSPSIGDLLQRCYDNQPLTIEKAQLVTEDSARNTITISGTSTFLNVADLAITSTFFLDESEEVQSIIKYALLGDASAPGDWKFSTSFPNIPTGFNVLPGSIEASPHALLDTLNLSDAFFVLTTQAQDDFENHVRLEQGMNFVGKVNLPAEILTIFSDFVSSRQGLTIYGSIHIPKETDTIPSLQPLQRPWDLETPVPGINLKVNLDLDFKAGNLKFDRFFVRIYSPHATDWLDNNRAYEPDQGFTATIAIPSAEVQATISAASAGSNSLLFNGAFQGAKLKKLANLIDISGSDSLASHLPEQLRTIEDTLKEIELLTASVVLIKNKNKITASATYFTIGLPHITWQVWENHFLIQDLFCAFSVHDPFGSASLTAQVAGTCLIENQPIQVFASTAENFTVYAELEEHAAIPLKNLLHTYVPHVPPPSDLTIDSLGIAIAPYHSYSMALIMAEDADAWHLGLGNTQLVVEDVNLSLIYPSGGTVSGGVSGSIRLGEVAQVSVAYDIPGNIQLQGHLPNIKLTELAREIAQVSNFYLPAGFPDLELRDSQVLFSKESQPSDDAEPPTRESSYAFSLATTVTINQSAELNLAAAVLKTPETTGFAAGLWTPASSTGWSPGSLWKPLSFLQFEQVGLFFCSIEPTTAQVQQVIPADVVPAIAGLGPVSTRFALRSGVTLFTTLNLHTGSVEALKYIFGDSVTFKLFASATQTGETTMIAHLGDDHPKGQFTFSGFFLIWEKTKDEQVDVSLHAGGNLAIGSSSPLSFDLGGTLRSDSSFSIDLSVDNWVKPFGYERLTIEHFHIGIELINGLLEMTLGGMFSFLTRKQKRFTFTVVGAIADFEVPTGLAFSLTSANHELLTFGEIIEGITTIDVYELKPTNAIESSWIQMIKIIDQILQIRELEFWAVENGSIRIGRKSYEQGFGFKGDIQLFGKPVLLDVMIEESLTDSKFHGKAELPDAVVVGNVLSLTRTESESDKGPILEVASHIVDNQHPYYLFVAARVVLLDIVRADIFGEATEQGFQFVYHLQIGRRDNGVWADQMVHILVDANQLAFSAGISINLGFSNVTLGPLKIDGLEIIPAISLNSQVGASLELSGNVSKGKFGIKGSLDFDTPGTSWHPSLDINIDLSTAPTQLKEVGNHILNWLKTEPEKVFAEILKDFTKFLDWAKKQFEQFKEKAVELARFMQNQFQKAEKEIAEALKTVGYALEKVIQALEEGLNLAREEAEKLANAAFTCATTTAAALL
jgi:gas vesicle protein